MTAQINLDSSLHRIVIVGGGAGGLELATQLGDTLGKKRLAQITLIDKSRTHLWKPLLHEVAAGGMDLDTNKLEYLAQAHWHYFRFRLGSMDGLNRAERKVYVAPTFDENGDELIPRRVIPYDTLVIAVGSTTNDYGTPGAAEHAISLDTAEDAERFRQRLVNACIRANAQTIPLRPEQLQVAIIGGGATGVELAAQLHNTTRQLIAYGLDKIDPEKDIKLSIIEAAERILPMLPERLSKAAEEQLKPLGVHIYTGERVTQIMANAVQTQKGRMIQAELIVWAAGIKAPDFLREIDGLETNRINQLMVQPTLQTTLDENIFAFGDCASCPWPEKNTNVPPRAQAAHQQASFLVKAIKTRLHGHSIPAYRYRDFGSLVSLGKYSTVGSLMGALTGGSLFLEGYFARLMYLSLYKMHLYELHGFFKVFFDTLARLITRRTEPPVKLH
ncbi:MAG TPA: NAD(P)/FAD-dependent oxidoreductase [Burkholderiales bacterium]|nr:NAD(P)/FAD-dependent oxidoreductase [Burkholderiales bacterium]